MDGPKTRREFLVGAISFVAVIPALGGLGGCAVAGLPMYKPVQKNGMIALSLSDIPELTLDGGAVQIENEGIPHPIVVVRLNVEAFAAIVPICSHLGCSVRKEGPGFLCPCHGSEYDLEGGVIQGPAGRPLRRYRTEFAGDILTVHLRD